MSAVLAGYLVDFEWRRGVAVVGLAIERSRVRVSAGHFSVKTLEKFLAPMVSPGWVTVIRVNHLSNQPPRSTQPSIPPGSVNEYQLWLESKGRYGSFRWRMNAGCSGKTVTSLENACHT